MAEEMKFLRGLPVSLQAEIMEHFSKAGKSKGNGKIPIEIDGKVYMIPKPVSDLIDSLTAQVYGLSED